MANLSLGIRQTASALSPFISQLILKKKERERQAKQKIEELRRKENEQTKKARQQFLIKNFDNLPQQFQDSALSEFGIQPPFQTEPELQRLDQANLLPQEREIALQELRKQEQEKQFQERLRALGLTKQSLANLVSKGSAQIPGLQQSPESVAKTRAAQEAINTQKSRTLTEKEKALTQKSLQEFNKARANSQRQLANVRRKQTKGNGTQQRQALNDAQRSLTTELKLLDDLFINDPEAIGGEEVYNQRRLEISNALLDVRKQLNEIGGVKESPDVKKINRLLQLRDSGKIGLRAFERDRKNMALQIKDAVGKGLSKAKAKQMLKLLFEIK